MTDTARKPRKPRYTVHMWGSGFAQATEPAASLAEARTIFCDFVEDTMSYEESEATVTHWDPRDAYRETHGEVVAVMSVTRRGIHIERA